MKTLREDEEAGNKAFAEKILVEDGFFFCKVCKKMLTVSKMRWCHTVTCGKSKKKNLDSVKFHIVRCLIQCLEVKRA